jgi:DNA-binding CsgD family transcriptional regulator
MMWLRAPVLPTEKARSIPAEFLAASFYGPPSAAIILLGSSGRVEVITPKAVALVGKYLWARALRGDTLPDLLQRWLARQQMQLVDSTDAPPSPESLVVQRKGTRLAVRLFQDLRERLLLLEESSEVPERIDGFGLTRREGEVLAWISRGKTNRDIAAILGTSPRTVQKHAEHIFCKLGVETRTAAASKALTLGAIRTKS